MRLQKIFRNPPGIPTSFLYQESESEEVQLSEGNNRWYEVRRRFIPWVDGRLAQLLIATDITARKEAEELSRQQEERMQFTSRLTTMGEMASSLAHELNQPLSAISNYCMGVAKRLENQLDPAACLLSKRPLNKLTVREPSFSAFVDL